MAICGFCLAEAAVILGQSPYSASFPLLARLAPLFAPNANSSSGSAAAPLSVYLSPYSLAAFLLIAAGGAFRLWAMRTLGKFFVMEVSLQKDHRLATGGPYALVRHPSYAGYALIVLGDALFLLGDGSYLSALGVWERRGWAALLACAVAGRSLFVAAVLMPRRAGREDAVLREEFRREWEAWAERTPYKLVPYVF